jgi:hypothetical protein
MAFYAFCLINKNKDFYDYILPIIDDFEYFEL